MFNRAALCLCFLAQVESQRLNWIRHNQSQLRTETYAGFRDALGSEEGLSATGQPKVLPSSFTGGPRYMQQQYQDAMAVCRKKSKPDLFITMTCNPQWPEVESALLPHQKPNDRPDILARVFRLKLKALLKDLTQGHVLGKVIGHCYTIEFQKRGLPHAHILLILHPDDKPTTTDDYDSIVSAEIPDVDADPDLYSTVSSCMMHGPCGQMNRSAPCMTQNDVEGTRSSFFSFSPFLSRFLPSLSPQTYVPSATLETTHL